MLPKASEASDFRRWDRYEVRVTVRGRTWCELWDGSRPLVDVPLVGWSLRKGRRECFAVTPSGERRTFYRASADVWVLALESGTCGAVHVELRRRSAPPAVFSPARALTPSEAIVCTRFHVYCGMGSTLLADRAVGTLFRGAIDEKAVLIYYRRGPQAYVYTKVEGLFLHVRNGRILAFPPGRRFEVSPDAVERGVFRWEGYWWRVSAVR